MRVLWIAVLAVVVAGHGRRAVPALAPGVDLRGDDHRVVTGDRIELLGDDHSVLVELERLDDSS